MGLSTTSTDMSVPMVDLETGIKKEMGVTITTVNTNDIARPPFGRRKTTSSILGPTESSNANAYDTEEDAFTKVGNFFWKIHTTNVLTRYALYILPVATLLAIPLILTDTVYPKADAGRVRLLGLFVWIEVIWLGLWVCKLCAKAMPILFQAACGLISTGIRKYSLILAALEIPMSLFLWSIVAYTTTPLICKFGHDNACSAPWLKTFQTVFRAGIIVAAIFLVEKTLVQLISVNYHRKQYDDKIKESKKLIRLLDMLYDASRALFPEYCREFEREDADIQGNTLTEVREAMAKAGGRNITQALSRMGRARDKATAAFGAMASDITGKQVFSTTSAHAIVLEALESEKACKALASRLWLSLVGEGKEALYRSDLHEVLGHSRFDEAEDIFNVLDRDGNGDVSLEEMTMFVIDISEDRKNRTVSMQDISYVIGVLDSLLSLVVLASIAFIYASFFSKTFASKTTQLWSTFTALGFAIGGTVTEFLACVIFIFIKHPYDIGDRVDIDRVQLIVERISLMYSVFRRIDSDKTVQIPHNVANSLWIENVSRSRSMKEQYNFSVCAKTTNADILVLRAELEKFVKAPENKRDFIPEIDIELLSLGDLKQLDLRVEIKHKVSKHTYIHVPNHPTCSLLSLPMSFILTHATVQLRQRTPPPNPPQQIHGRPPRHHARRPHQCPRLRRALSRRPFQPLLRRQNLRHRSSLFPRSAQRRRREQAVVPDGHDVEEFLAGGHQ